MCIYTTHSGHKVSRAEYEKALYEKREDVEFLSDITPLLPIESQNYNPLQAFIDVEKKLISLLPGDPWKRRE